MNRTGRRSRYQIKFSANPVGKCRICDEGAYGHHHIVPKESGGSGDMVNKVLLCDRCHDIAEEMANRGKDLTPRNMDLIRLQIL